MHHLPALGVPDLHPAGHVLFAVEGARAGVVFLRFGLGLLVRGVEGGAAVFLLLETFVSAEVVRDSAGGEKFKKKKKGKKEKKDIH